MAITSLHLRRLASKLTGTLTREKEASLVELYGSKEQKLNLELYRANCCVNDEVGWSQHVSNYLAQFNLCSIRLAGGHTTKFERLTADPDHYVNDGPKVSILVAAFNAAQTIDVAVESLLKQTWRNIEVLVVDDHSSDETWPHLNKLTHRDERVKIFRNTVNAGPFVSRNRILSLATGEYITGHDGDDWTHPQRIERQMTHLSANAGSVGITNYMLRLDSNFCFRHLASEEGAIYENPARLHPVSGLMATDAFRQKLGHWDSVRFSGDGELFKRAKTIFGKQYLDTRLVTNLALDLPTSIMNDTKFGRRNGRRSLSATRVAYRNSYGVWHRTLHADNGYVEFPLEHRKFEAPSAMVVDAEIAKKLLADTDNRTQVD